MKKDRDKKLIQKCRPISLLNIDLAILSRAPADYIKKYLPFYISSNQAAYVEGRFISEGGRYFSDIWQITDLLKLRSLLVTLDIQKACDSVYHFYFNNHIKANHLAYIGPRWYGIRISADCQQNLLSPKHDTSGRFLLETFVKEQKREDDTQRRQRLFACLKMAETALKYVRINPDLNPNTEFA